ncbi:DUF397 domain-containing protein [Lentzea sp. NPDC102401]|uniref:DUF397 domain-containing protein n=1 Tax=Lentzea sp. NPDC102401 TaxID=3364128 RepID=UPI0037F9EC17
MIKNRTGAGVNSPDFSSADWRKSSRSGSSNGGGGTNCVEVAVLGARVGVRDSKNVGSWLTFSDVAWRQWVSTTLGTSHT